jgi:adenylosuccinate synthase
LNVNEEKTTRYEVLFEAIQGRDRSLKVGIFTFVSKSNLGSFMEEQKEVAMKNFEF